MAGGKIVGITIDIEGKSDGLVKSLKEANSSINSTSNALKDVDKALKLDPTNVELLTQKEDLLNKQIEQTNAKLEILQQVANDANDALERGDISQEQYASLTAEISMTASTLSDLESSAEETNNTLADIDSGEIDDVADSSEDAASGLEDTSEAAGSAGDALVKLGEVGGAAIAGAAAAAASLLETLKEVGGALVDCTVQAGDYADELHTMESKTGISTERLQEMHYVAGLIDVDVSTMTSSMTKLEKSMNSANETNAKYEEKMAALDEQLKAGKITHDEWVESAEEIEASTITAYDKLGISITDANGKLRDNEEVFWEVVDALGNMEEGTERDLLAMELLGKSAKELNPLIEAGSEGFNKLAEEAHEVGYVMDDETLDSFQQFDDQMERLNKGADAAKNALGTVLLPMLTEMSEEGTDALTGFTKAVKNSNGDIDKVVDAFGDMLPKLLKSVGKFLPKILEMIGQAITALINVILDNLPEIIDTAMEIIKAIADTLLTPENIKKIIDAATKIIMTLVEYLIQNLPMIIDAAMQVILSLVQGLSDAIPELIPVMVDAMFAIVDTLIDNLPLLLEAALQLIVAFAIALVDALPEIITRLPEIISGIVEFLLSAEGLGKIVEAGFTLFTGLVTNIDDIILSLIEALGQMLTDLLSYINGDMFDDITGAFGDIFGDIIDDAFTWGADIIQNICDGFASMWDTLTGWVGDIASAIGDFLGFSVPKKGPLHAWAYNNPGADMIDLYAEGIEQNLPELQKSIDMTANVIAGTPDETIAAMQATGYQTASAAFSGNQIDYTSQLSGITNALGALGVDRQVVIPVYIGNERLETIVANANANNNFISGGR